MAFFSTLVLLLVNLVVVWLLTRKDTKDYMLVFTVVTQAVMAFVLGVFTLAVFYMAIRILDKNLRRQATIQINHFAVRV